MKKLKKLTALLLTVLMTLAMAVTAFAAGGNTGNLTVKVNDNNTLKNQTISVYKLFDLTVGGTGEDKVYGYTVNETYKAGIISALGLEGDKTSDELYKAVSTVENIQKFANDFTSYALQNELSATATSDKITTDAESYTFNSLDFGYYLVHQTGTETLQSALVNVENAAEGNVTLKGEAPEIEKTADKTTVEIGDIVKYEITGIIPDLTGYESYVYKIHDTLTDGLDFVDSAGTAVSDTNYTVMVKIGDGEEKSESATLSGDHKRTMTLDLSQWVIQNQASKGQQFTITYYAKVNKDAVVETNNNASLEYGNDPESTVTTVPVEAETPTYPLQINKTESKNGQFLAGATFRLYRAEADAKAGNDNAIKVTGENGNYYVDKNGTSMDMVSNATAVGTTFNLKLNGLAEGTYWLAETKAPDGYNKITAPIKVTITKSATDNADDWTISFDDKVESDKTVDVVNTTGTILPGTGGIGTVLFTAIGVVLILGVTVSFVISRKRRTNA